MKNQLPNNSVYDTTIRMLILLLIVVWCLLIMHPFVNILLWSLILALAILPLHTTLSKKIGGKPKLASFIIVSSILAIFLIPTFIMIGSIADEVKELKTSYDDGKLSIPPPTAAVKEWPIIGKNLYNTWQNASDNLEQTILNNKEQLTDVVSNLAHGLLSATGGVVQIMVALIIAGILLVIGGVGEGIRKFFRKLAGEKGDEFADIAKTTVGNVVRGVLGVALIQAFLLGLGFSLAGVPYAGVLTLVALLLCILQIPPVLVAIPVIMYLFSGHEVLSASLWTVYLLLASTSDNIIKPILLGKGAPVPMLIIFIGVVGGFILSGFIGLFTGAIIMSIGYKLFMGWMNSNETIK